MKAWCVKKDGEGIQVCNIYSYEYDAERDAFDRKMMYVPVEITEIAEADTVESKEPDYKKMWVEFFDLVLSWDDKGQQQVGAVSYTLSILRGIEARHAPREKTAEEKLAEVRGVVAELENYMQGGATDVGVRRRIEDLKDLCK